MNNIELEQKVLEILNTDNYFEMVLKAKDFEIEYKKSDFYKVTKKSLCEVLKEAKLYYALQFKDLTEKIQDLINNLSLDKISEILDQVTNTFEQENNETKEMLEVLKDLK